MLLRRSKTWLALAVAVAIVGTAATPASGAQKAIWGPLTLPGGGSAFPLYRQLGVDSFQTRLDWSQVAPTRPANPADPSDPAYAWPADVDQAIEGARANGIDVVLLVTYAPGWANGDRAREWAPANPQDYADFIAAASRRYPSVRRWMIWGEPNLEGRFKPNAQNDPVAARTYAPILDAAYAALKSVSPRNVVIGGMTWSGGTVKPQPFLDQMRLPDGSPPRLDWFGHNPFPFRKPNLREIELGGGWRDMSDTEVFAREVRAAYRPLRRKPKLWLSEFTILSDHASNAFQNFVTQQEQAQWLTAAYGIANRLPSVEGLGWFTLLDQPEAPSASNWGLLEHTGERKPAFAAFQRGPSRRLRPRVRAPRRVTRARLGASGLSVRVRPRSTGRVVVRLVNLHGRTLARAVRRVRAGGRVAFTLRRSQLRRGRYRIFVDAARGERVRRVVVVR